MMNANAARCNVGARPRPPRRHDHAARDVVERIDDQIRAAEDLDRTSWSLSAVVLFLPIDGFV
jgi:hypothetical protein